MKTKTYSSPCMKVSRTKIRMSILAGSTKSTTGDEVGVTGHGFDFEDDNARERKVTTQSMGNTSFD